MVVGFFASGVDPMAKCLHDCGLYIGEPEQVKRNVTNEDMAQTGMRLTETFTPDHKDDLKYVEPYLNHNWMRDQKLRPIKMAYDLLAWKMEKLADGRVWGFRSRRALIHLPMYIRKMPDLSIIIMLRSPSDVVRSLMNKRRERGENNWGFEQDIDAIQNHWQNYYHIARRDLERYNPDYVVIRYEDLIDDPECAVSIACQAAGLTYNPDSISNLRKSRPDVEELYPAEQSEVYEWYLRKADETKTFFVCGDNDTP